MSRHGEMARVRALRISPDLVLNLAVRGALAFVVADQVGRRMFYDYGLMQRHKMARYEAKKVMRMWPDAMPYQTVHRKANGYFWV